MSTTRFTNIELGPPIEVFALQKTYVDDKFENKVSLAVGGRLTYYIFYAYLVNIIFQYDKIMKKKKLLLYLRYHIQ